MSETITFVVRGIPQPKGSTKAFMRPGMRFPVVTNDNLKTKPWAEDVRRLAQEHAPAGGPWIGPVSLDVQFMMPMPKYLKGKIVPHTKKPDLDKLLRTIKDAMKGVIYLDDAQVNCASMQKMYSATPGLVVRAVGEK